MKTVQIIESILKTDSSVSESVVAKIIALLTGREEKPAELLTQKEVAKLFLVSRITVWKWEKEGKIKSILINGIKRFKTKEIEKLMEV